MNSFAKKFPLELHTIAAPQLVTCSSYGC